MKWFEKTAERLQQGKTYKRQQLIGLLRQDYPYVSANSYQWAVAEMAKAGLIIRTGYDCYEICTAEHPEIYQPRYSETAQRVISLLNEYFPGTKATVFESALLTEFSTESSTDNIIFLETEKESSVSVFKMLQLQGIPNLMYKPSPKEFRFLRTRDSIVVSDLVS